MSDAPKVNEPSSEPAADSTKLDLLGVHFAVCIFVATAILWAILDGIGDVNPIWAISSMIATSDPQVHLALQTFRGRIANSLLGCAIGLAFVLAVGTEFKWMLPFALAFTVLVSAYAVRITVMWRQAPITAAIVIASGFSEHSRLTGMQAGLKRVGEVLLGCFVGLAVAWALSKIWPPPKTGFAPGGQRK